MTLRHLAPPALIPIRPNNCVEYRLCGSQYRLMNGTTHCVAPLVNHGTGPATVAGCIAGASGTLTIEAGDAFMLGWSVRDTIWRALRMCGARIIGPDSRLDGVQMHPGPVPADADFLVEALDGTTACATLSMIGEYLAGRLPTLSGLRTFPVRDAPK